MEERPGRLNVSARLTALGMNNDPVSIPVVMKIGELPSLHPYLQTGQMDIRISCEMRAHLTTT